MARLVPWTPDADERLQRSLAFLGWDAEATELQQVGDAVGLVVGGLCAVAAIALGLGIVGFGAGVTAGVCVAAGVRSGPRALATARRTRALGQAPGLVSRAVLRMRLTPTPETAAVFAAETGRGRLAESLECHASRARGTGRSGLSTFADEWAAWFPALRRALSLVESAGDARPNERARALDSALEVTLDGTRETMAEFAATVRGPATALYAFGVLLPLALVALLPAAGIVGVSVPLAAVVVGYDVVLPIGLTVASAWLLVRRPVAFPPAPIPRSHPAVPERRPPAVIAGAVAGGIGWLVAGRLVSPWTAWVVAPGMALGVGLVVAFRPMTAVRERVRAVERGLPDALSLVGREVSRGRAVETAMEQAGETLDTATGEVLAEATRTQRRLEVGVRESLVGEYGALRGVPSERARSTAELLALAAAEGKPAGPAVVAMADHIDDLHGVEDEVRRRLQQVTGTLSNTATVFGPLIGGATITLAEQMRTEGPLAGGLAPGPLGLAVGVYVLALAALLTALATGLERGLDRSLVGYRVGRALVVATTVFCVGLVVTRWIV